MSMERGIITIAECGTVILPDVPNESVWMSEMELVELFRVVVPTLRAAVRAIYKSGVLKECEVQKYIRFENGYNADVFGLPMIAALAFRINTFGAKQVRKAILEKLYLRKEKTSIFFSLGINSMKSPKYQA